MIAQNWLFRAAWLGLAGSVAVSGVLLASSSRALAQSNIVPDGTLGAERSGVVPLDAAGLPVDVIDGGAIRGPNLFHSFKEFNVAERRGAYFRNPSNDIQNILARVTGRNRSEILGTLGTLNATSITSSPNLFLINPNGIIFGPNASLDVAGSFVATTANAIQLGNSGLFSASEPTTSNLLAVNPSALFFNALSQSTILNRSSATQTVTGELLGFSINAPEFISGLQVLNDKSLVLVGGDLVLEGGNLTAPEGRIELGSVASAGLVNLNLGNRGLTLGYDGIQNFGSIRLSESSSVDVSGEGGGSIQIRGAQLLMESFSGISATTLGARDGEGIFIQTTDALIIDDSAIGTVVLPGATGKGGNITIRTGELTVSGDVLGLVLTGTDGVGNAGDLTVEANRVTLRDGGQLLTSTFSSGNAGNLTVHAPDFVQVVGTTSDGEQPSKLATQVTEEATGSGGDLLIETNHLIVQDGAQIQAGTFGKGRGGTLTVNALDSIEIIGTDGDGGPSGLFTGTYGAADAGNLTITTRLLSIRDGGTVSASTAAFLGKGRGGNLTVNASEVEVLGTSADDEFRSSLVTETGVFLELPFGIFPASGGNLMINTGRLTIRDGAVVSTITSGLVEQASGRAGDLIINSSESVEVIGSGADGTPSLLTAKTTGVGDAGNLTIRTGKLIIRDGAEVSTSTSGNNDNFRILDRGQGGILDVTASDFVEVSGVNSGLVSFSVLSSGDAGSLTIRTGLLTIRAGATVSTSSIGRGRGGDLNVTADIVEVSGSGTAFSDQFGLGMFTLASNISTQAASLRDAGDLTINAGQLIVRDGAELSADTLGLGRGGDMRIQANSLSLTGGSISSRSGTSQISADNRFGNAGNIFISVRDRLQANNGNISTTATQSSGGAINITTGDIRLQGNSDITTFVASGTGGGGNITLKADSILAFEDSDILAFSLDGNGGNVTLDTPVFFGFRFQPAPRGTDPRTLDGNDRVDINATGQLSSGTITLPDVSFIQNSLAELSQNLIDPNALVANSCIARGSRQGGSFTITGPGGLPTRPGDANTLRYSTVGVRPISEPATSREPASAWKIGDPIVEPDGLYQLADGRLVLSQECR